MDLCVADTLWVVYMDLDVVALALASMIQESDVGKSALCSAFYLAWAELHLSWTPALSAHHSFETLALER